MTTRALRICVVTPYFKEERALLDRCLASVERQTVAVDHLLVADGFPQDWLDAAPVRHVRLDRPHRDYGNAARGVGALLAIAEGYDGIAFLDADNWYDDDHIASCLTAAESGDPIFVVAQRRFRRPDGSIIDGSPHDVPLSKHVDTNCFLFLRGAFAELHRWCTMPNELAAYGDQIFGKMLRAGALPSVLVPRRTVNYHCLSEPVYRLIGEAPPPGCKPMIQWADAQAWLSAQPPAVRRHLERMTGLSFEALAAPAEDAPAPATTSPVQNTLAVEVPGSPHHAHLRRTEADVAEYRRIFVAQAYASVTLPTEARLIVDIAAGIGLSAVFLQARYPNAVVVAAEPDRETFDVLSCNVADRPLCQAVHARVTAVPSEPGFQEPGSPTISFGELIGSLGHRPIDLLRLTPLQWDAIAAADPDALAGVRAVLIDDPDAPRSLDVSTALDAEVGIRPSRAAA